MDKPKRWQYIDICNMDISELSETSIRRENERGMKTKTLANPGKGILHIAQMQSQFGVSVICLKSFILLREISCEAIIYTNTHLVKNESSTLIVRHEEQTLADSRNCNAPCECTSKERSPIQIRKRSPNPLPTKRIF